MIEHRSSACTTDDCFCGERSGRPWEAGYTVGYADAWRDATGEDPDLDTYEMRALGRVGPIVTWDVLSQLRLAGHPLGRPIEDVTPGL